MTQFLSLPQWKPHKSHWGDLDVSGPWEKFSDSVSLSCGPAEQTLGANAGKKAPRRARKRQSQAHTPPKHCLRTSRRHMLVFLQKEARENKQKAVSTILARGEKCCFLPATHRLHFLSCGLPRGGMELPRALHSRTQSVLHPWLGEGCSPQPGLPLLSAPGLIA